MPRDGKRGGIVMMGSVSSLVGIPNEAIYTATKRAQLGSTRALGFETRPHGVKVTVFAAGGTNTGHAFGMGRTPGDPALHDLSDPEDVAEAVVFAVTQLPKSRVFLLGVRPMAETLND
jgi:short-subunit dehydrogenase